MQSFDNTCINQTYAGKTNDSRLPRRERGVGFWEAYKYIPLSFGGVYIFERLSLLYDTRIDN